MRITAKFILQFSNLSLILNAFYNVQPENTRSIRNNLQRGPWSKIFPRRSAPNFAQRPLALQFGPRKERGACNVALGADRRRGRPDSGEGMAGLG